MPRYVRNARGQVERSGVLLNVLNEPILTHAHPDLMARIAAAGGGRTLHLSGGDIARQVRQFAEQAILPEAVPIDDAITQEPQEWSWLPVTLGLGLLLAEQILRRRMASRLASPPAATTRGAILRA